jgi:capsular polysaccharide biosynthesis protein
VKQATATVGESQTIEENENLNSVINAANRTPIFTMGTYVGVLKSDTLMARVIKKLNLYKMGYTPRNLANHIKTTMAKDSHLIEINVNNSNPDLAVKIANTVGQEFIGMMTEWNREIIDRSITYLKSQEETIKDDLEKTKDPMQRECLNNVLVLLTEGIKNAQIVRDMDLKNINLIIISPAVSPYLVMPRRLIIIVVAFILGFIVSIGIAVLLEFMKDTANVSTEINKRLPSYSSLPISGITNDQAKYANLTFKNIAETVIEGIEYDTISNIQRISQESNDIKLDYFLFAYSFVHDHNYDSSRMANILSVLDSELYYDLIESISICYDKSSERIRYLLFEDLYGYIIKTKRDFKIFFDMIYRHNKKDLIYYGVMAKILNNYFGGGEVV